jgi:hypothetical protein
LNGSTPNFLANGGIKPATGSGIQTFATLQAQRDATSNHVVVNQQDPYSMQWNLGIQHVFAKNYTAEARYLGTRGVHLNTQSRINIMPVVNANRFLPTFLTAPTAAQLAGLTTTLTQLQAIDNVRPDFAAAGFDNTNIVQFTPNGGSIYHGLALQLNRRFDNGLQFQSAYTFSHAIDDSTADFFSTRLTPRRPQDFQNLANDRSTSALDRRHRFTFAMVYDMPYFKSGNWLEKNLLGNWEVAPIYTLESPEIASVQSGTDSNLNGDSAGDRAIFNPAGVPGTGSGVTPIKNAGGAIIAYQAINPNAQYITAGQGALATAGRNTIPTQRINNWDMNLLKRFSITERTRFEFGAQLFNIFNHPQFVPGTLNDVRSIGQSGIAVLNYLKPSSPTFENARATFASNARTIQISGKFVF